MKIKDITDTIEKEGSFKVYPIEYKSNEDKEKYGLSFDTYTDKDFIWVRVNGGLFKCRRICEEYGRILFIYNGEQISWKPEDITTLEINPPE